RDRIVAHHLDLRAQLHQVVDEIESEAVVVVDDEDVGVHGALLPETGFGRNAGGFLGGGDEGAGLVAAFGGFVGRVAVGDDACAGLHVHDAVLDHGGAQDDAAVDRAVGREIADAASVGAAG